MMFDVGDMVQRFDIMHQLVHRTELVLTSNTANAISTMIRQQYNDL